MQGQESKGARGICRWLSVLMGHDKKVAWVLFQV